MWPVITRFLGSPWLLHAGWLALVIVSIELLDHLPEPLHQAVLDHADTAPMVFGLVAAVLAMLYNLANTALVACVLVAAHWVAGETVAMEALGATEALAWAGVLVPFNVVLFALLEDRGLLSRFGLLRMAIVGAQGGLLVAVWHGAPWLLERAVDKTFLPEGWTAWTALADQALLALALGIAAMAVVAALERTPPVVGLLASLVAFGYGVHLEAQEAATYGLGAMVAAALLTLIAASLQEAHRLAFRDGLTGLPNRRAMEAMLRQVGGQYTVAMLDVDHFKQFNDRYGHAVGDQVLRRVASHLRQVGAGGRSFRYGGEEFAVIFPGRGVDEVLDVMETLRAAIADDAFRIREEDRPASDRHGKRRRGRGDGTALGITISIGVSEPTEAGVQPEDVVRAADEALYQAKERGRNRVSHV